MIVDSSGHSERLFQAGFVLVSTPAIDTLFLCCLSHSLRYFLQIHQNCETLCFGCFFDFRRVVNKLIVKNSIVLKNLK